MQDRMVLLSIKKKNADQILSGKKRYEYRRKMAKLAPPYILLLNVSRKIVGSCIVEDIHTLPINQLIKKTVVHTPQTADHIRHYFSGLDMGTALEISKPIKLPRAISLIDVPVIQSFCYIDRLPSKLGRIWQHFEDRFGEYPIYKQLGLF